MQVTVPLPDRSQPLSQFLEWMFGSSCQMSWYAHWWQICAVNLAFLHQQVFWAFLWSLLIESSAISRYIFWLCQIASDVLKYYVLSVIIGSNTSRLTILLPRQFNFARVGRIIRQLWTIVCNLMLDDLFKNYIAWTHLGNWDWLDPKGVCPQKRGGEYAGMVIRLLQHF